MSEFSDCLYLFSATISDAAKLLRKAQRFGLVWPAEGEYAPFLAEGTLYSTDGLDALLAVNPGTLLSYSYAADHGVGLTIYEGQACVVTVELSADGANDNDVDSVLAEVTRLGLVPASGQASLRKLLEGAPGLRVADVPGARTALANIFALPIFDWLGCSDLSTQPEKDLKARFEGAKLVMKRCKGKTSEEQSWSPNAWCSVPDMPDFMYFAVPQGEVDEAALRRHVDYWVETDDYDNANGRGFWVYSGYCKALPQRYAYLANRMMNLRSLPGDYRAHAEQTIRGILSTCPADFDFEPYLQQKRGGMSC